MPYIIYFVFSLERTVPFVICFIGACYRHGLRILLMLLKLSERLKKEDYTQMCTKMLRNVLKSIVQFQGSRERVH